MNMIPRGNLILLLPSRLGLFAGIRSCAKRLAVPQSQRAAFSNSCILLAEAGRETRDPLQQYNYKVERGVIRDDPHQRQVIGSLMSIYTQLQAYQPPQITEAQMTGQKAGGLWGKLSLSNLFGSKDKKIGGARQPNGIYLFGDVGCGKTMLMDLFYSTVPAHLTRKRIHFHSFMQEVHKRSHKLHALHGNDFDTAPYIAAEIAKESNVLCFDEFQVTDVADAMILRRIIEALLSPEFGVVLFITSNRAPDELYMNGVQRQSFIPCIELIKTQTEVYFLDSPTDYRKIERPLTNVYFFPPSHHALSEPTVKVQADRHIAKWYEYFAQGAEKEHDVSLTIWGRPLRIPTCSGNKVAQFTFQELCGSPLSAADYIELATSFQAIIVTDIPSLSIREKDVARRLITFLDAAYENKIKLVVTAVRPFDHLFTDDVPGVKKEEVVDSLSELSEEADIEIGVAAKSGMFSGEEERFAFARALSRLHQMSTKEWVDS
ncbi:AFG1-like ATPase [Nadsonia fulvescens var. elongata DSM 6958]|uniref:AFG1-like ATPase n=1 Tax=Nadsonia fulvescens var. elongata DSM 6958 TaxID=857566 RepID=A0A1E3PEC3_9ASCO|nr:AFG1-like ATPase [Nadsonia fulvescens var. elongata DSM 6958]